MDTTPATADTVETPVSTPVTPPSSKEVGHVCCDMCSDKPDAEVQAEDLELPSVPDTSDTYFIHFRAKIGLYTHGPTLGSGATLPPSHFERKVDAETFGNIRKKIHDLNLPEDMLKATFDCYNSTTHYFMDSIFFMSQFNTKVPKNEISREIEAYLWCFNEIAGDTYFEGDAEVYREPIPPPEDEESSGDSVDEGDEDDKYNSYLLVLDDIEVLIYNHDYTEKVCSVMSGTHWFKNKK